MLHRMRSTIKNRKIMGSILILLILIYFLIIKFNKINIFQTDTDYKPPKHDFINPSTYSLKIYNGNYEYVSSDKNYKFSFPTDWKVEKCIGGDCESSNAYKIYPPNGNESGGIGIDIFNPGSSCDKEPERLSKAGLWQEVLKTDVPQKYARATLLEGIQEDSSGQGDLYLKSTKYIQTKAACYLIMAGTKNNPKLYKQLQTIRDSFQVLK